VRTFRRVAELREAVADEGRPGVASAERKVPPWRRRSATRRDVALRIGPLWNENL